ncbi:hypothetical protein NP92_01315 [Anoxybacillus gonensis]|nr:hypothetical protein AFK25_04645 [Anoxybacillus gonensis]KGP61859.1 hypothetical protein NP92_01315 [Anoxybacillus gonensis]
MGTYLYVLLIRSGMSKEGKKSGVTKRSLHNTLFSVILCLCLFVYLCLQVLTFVRRLTFHFIYFLYMKTPFVANVNMMKEGFI